MPDDNFHKLSGKSDSKESLFHLVNVKIYESQVKRI